MIEKEYNYFWYNHGAMSSRRSSWIDKRIQNHDWEAFQLVKEMYDADDSKYKMSTKGTPMVYFPDHISVRDGDDFYSIPMNRKNFNLINYSENEHG